MRSCPFIKRCGNEGLFGELCLLRTNKVVVVAEAVGAVAIDAVEFGFHAEGFSGHEALEFGGAHVCDVHELHVARDHEADFLDGLVRIAETAEDDFGHVGSDFVVAVEAEALRFSVPRLRGGFADVVQEDGEGES